MLFVQVIEIDKTVQCPSQRIGRVVGGALDAGLMVHSEHGVRVRFEETGNAAHDRVEICKRIAGERRRQHPVERLFLTDYIPEFVKSRQPVPGLVPGDQRAVNGADRSADYPFRVDASLDQRLVGAERTATLQHEHDLLRSVARDYRENDMESIRGGVFHASGTALWTAASACFATCRAHRLP